MTMMMNTSGLSVVGTPAGLAWWVCLVAGAGAGAPGSQAPPMPLPLPAEYSYTGGAESTIHGGRAIQTQPADSFTLASINVTYMDAEGYVRSNKSENVGKYGSGYVGPAWGYVVHVANSNPDDDHSGCTRPFIGTTPIPRPPISWIALIKRGTCNFDIKVQIAFEAKAAGVLIYNDMDSMSLDKMKINSTKQRNISAVFTYKHRGEELARLVDGGTPVMVHMAVSSHCTRPAPNINRTSVLFVSISFILLMLMSLSWLVFYYIQRFRYIHAKDRLSKRLCSAAKKALSKIPIKNIKTEDKEMQGEGECCAVCIEPYKIADLLRILPCSHEFHKCCIDPWLLEHRTCPMCKMDILKHYGFVYTGSQESILQLDAEEGGRPNNASSPLPPALSRSSSFSEGHSSRSSRASSPDELTPSLSAGSPASPAPPNPATQEAAHLKDKPGCSQEPRHSV